MSNASSLLVSDIFFALSDKTRLSIVKRLSTDPGLSATRLSDDANITRQSIMKHLRVLERVGVIVRKRQGREVLYGLERARLEDARQFLDGISAGWDCAIERLRKSVEQE